MPSELSTDILPGEIAQIVESVFATMLGLDVVQCRKPWFHGGDRLTSAVHLAGDWNGAVLVECDARQACDFTGRFLEVNGAGGGQRPVVDDVVRDLLGELANMIGGNLKCVLSRGVRLSMPSVVDGSAYSLRVCGARVSEQLSFECAEGLFWVTVLSDPESESET